MKKRVKDKVLGELLGKSDLCSFSIISVEKHFMKSETFSDGEMKGNGELVRTTGVGG